MGGGLKNQWGVDDPAKAGSDQQSQQFQATFQREITVIGVHLQYTSANAEAARHDPLAARRDALYPAFQSALGQIDRANPAKAKGAIDKVIVDARTLNAEVTAFRKAAEKARNDWQARQAKFDAAVRQVEELEAWGDAKAPPLRGLVDGIRTQVNERKFAPACTTLDQLLPKLKPIYEEYLKQKAAKPKYEQALAEQSARLEPLKAAERPSQPMTAKAGEADAALQQARAKADTKDFVGGLEQMKRVKAAVDALDKLARDPQRVKFLADRKAADGLVSAQADTGLFKTLEADWNAIRDLPKQSDPLADAGDYAGANKLLADLKTKITAFQKKLEELKKQKKAYEDAAAALKFPPSPQPYAKLEPMLKDINESRQQMEAAAQKEDFAAALKIAQDLTPKIEAYGRALAELDRQKKGYEDALAPLKELLAKACEARGGKLTPLQSEIVTLRQSMEAAATAGDFEKATKLCGDLAVKLEQFKKEDAESREGLTFEVDWESGEIGKWGEASRLTGGFKIKAKGKGELIEKGSGASATAGGTTNAGVRGEIELGKQKAVEIFNSIKIKEIKETFNAELSGKKVELSLGVKATFDSSVPWCAPLLTGKFNGVVAEWEKIAKSPDNFTAGGVEIGGGVQAKGTTAVNGGWDVNLAVDVTFAGSVKLNWKVIAPELALKFGSRVVQIAAGVTAGEAIVIGGAVAISVVIIYGTFRAMAQGSEIRGLYPLSEKATNEFVDAYIAGFQGAGSPGGLATQGYTLGQNAFTNLKKSITSKYPEITDITDEEIRQQTALQTKRGFVWSEVNPKAKQAIWQGFAEGHKGDKKMLRDGHVNLFGRLPSENDRNFTQYLNE